MKRKIKILHVLHSVGGVDVSLRLILESINHDEFENVIVHGTNDTKKSFLNSKGGKVNTYCLPIYRDINLVKDFSSLRRIISIIKKEKPDIIHAHSAKGGVLGKISGKLTKTPVLHTPQAYSYLSAPNKFKKIAYLFIEKQLSFSGNKILASSNSEKKRAISEVGYPEDRTLLFNNSILPISHIEDLSIKKTWPDEYICSVGRPSYQKNIEFMLDVLYELKKQKKDIHLVLMGVGYHSPNLKIIKSKIRLLNLKNNITLLEWTERGDIFNIIKNSMLYLTTARYEGLPYSVIESLALGKPIVATDADGNRDLVFNGKNGYVIPNEDPLEFSQKVLNLLNNEQKIKEFSKNSKILYEEKFNMVKNIKKLEKIYKNNIA